MISECNGNVLAQAFVLPILLFGLSMTPRTQASKQPAMNVQMSAERPVISILGWDTEGGHRAKVNLLRKDRACSLRFQRSHEWIWAADCPTKIAAAGESGAAYRIRVTPDAEVVWRILPEPRQIRMTISVEGSHADGIDGLELRFPFDPRVTPTTILPHEWSADGTVRLPAVISAPDFGQVRLDDEANRHLRGRLEGSRKEKWVDLIVEIPPPVPGKRTTLTLRPVRLPPPAGLKDVAMWNQARRGWFGAMQPSSRWGEQGRPFSAPAGILANNVISDPASCSLWFYADQILWTPEVAQGISAAALVRRSIDWWLGHRTRETGEVVCYWDYGNFLDANAGPLIAAWDYVEATGDTDWTARRIDRLEFIAEFLAKRDIDGDGMVEAVQSGNLGTLRQPNRSCAWWDALNCGHKDGYTNALIYRAWRCLADLETRLGREDEATRYHDLADRLKASYGKTLYNPATGWLAWWKSADGELHDYASPTVNGMAIEYGLVDVEQGREILDRLWTKIDEVGFNRFDLGIPPVLIPVRRGDYLLPDAIGCPKREDGTDTFGHYMNGGITAGHTLHFLAAHYVVDRPERADKVLRAMLKRQAEGGFQNGVQDAGGRGIDWTDWNGNATGYEGYLADSFRFLQAVILREPEMRERVYRVLSPGDERSDASPATRSSN